jgi:hypothetical protein
MRRLFFHALEAAKDRATTATMMQREKKAPEGAFQDNCFITTY